VRAGVARLHNDNEGAVRSYLAARWLKRLMETNCPKFVVQDLLFATTYGVPLVIPSMRQTAAWISLWAPEIAREVISRDPRLLMDTGDPASLPLSVRERAEDDGKAVDRGRPSLTFLIEIASNGLRLRTLGAGRCPNRS
jgi:hypothetical protein